MPYSECAPLARYVRQVTGQTTLEDRIYYAQREIDRLQAKLAKATRRKYKIDKELLAAVKKVRALMQQKEQEDASAGV